MDTTDFLAKILPTEGFFVAALQRKGSYIFQHKVAETHADLAAILLQADAKGITAYHACASYRERNGVWDEKKQKNRVRVKKNTLFVRSQWIDIDVGEGKDYATRKEAVAALIIMCKALKIPYPMIILSGKGLHCYWTFTCDYPADDFTINSRAFCEAMQASGFKHDVKRTKDSASILRPIGTHNRKADPIPVTLYRDADPIDPVKFYNLFSTTIPTKAVNIPGLQTGDWESNTQTYAPSSVKAIAKHCRAVRVFATHKQTDPALPEDQWYTIMGLIKHTTEGEAIAHRWSAQGDARYDKGECQAKMDGWEHGPASCKAIRDGHPECLKCPHWGKITSPIQLGQTEDTPPPTKVKTALPVDRKQVVTKNILQFANLIPGQDQIKFWPSKYNWDGSQMNTYIKNDDGTGEWKAFSNTLYYPFLRYETEDDTRAMMLCALTDPKKNTWRVFELETKAVADARQLATSLGAQEIVYMNQSKERNQKFVQDVLHGLRAHGLETTTYNNFGWHDAGFVIGDKMITKNGPRPVFLGSKIPSDLQGDFGTKGTAMEWASRVDDVYNRPGAEPFQFVIAAAAAAIMVKLCDSDMWHGIPVAVTGGSGEGKTTICKVACSLFGNPRKLMIQANDEGTTMNALIGRVSTLRNLPMLLDEITGRETTELQAMLFALSNGLPKKRLRPDGSEVNPGQSWDTIAFITGNLSITRMLADSDRVKADATQVRCFEIPLEEGYNRRVFGDVNGKDKIEHQLLSQNYGAAGEEFLRFVIRNREKITTKLQAERSKLASTHTGADPRERFYYDIVANVTVAAGIMKQLGLISFDLKALRAWSLKHIVHMRSMRVSSLSTPEDYLQSFMAYLYQHTVITNYYRDGREKPPGAENVQPPLREPLARHAMQDRRFLVTCAAFNGWCKSQKVTPEWLHTHLEKADFILPEPVGGARQRICKGTSVSGVQARCIEFNYDMLDDSQMSLPDFISVVPTTEQKT